MTATVVGAYELEPQARDEPVVRVRDLRIRYGDIEALRGVDLEVYRGEILALLGPNGAGKTSFLEILEGYRPRTGGFVRVLGADPQEASGDWRTRIGVVLQESEPERELTVRECVELYAGYYPEPADVEEVLELVGLTAKANARCGRLSGGQKRRIDVGLALIGNPDIIFLDEPTTGFDPGARRQAWDMVYRLRALGKTIILTTHYMDEAEALADQIVLLVEGRISAQGTADEIASVLGSETRISFRVTGPIAVHELPGEVLETVETCDASHLTLRTGDPVRVLHGLTGWALQSGLDGADLTVSRPSLEDAYLTLVEGAPE